MMDPRASVIVPVYNVANRLDESVASLLEQTLGDVEVVLVDDGSTDGSAARCDAWERADERVVVIHQHNGGLSAARNAGLSVARGRFIAFLDGDDRAEPDMLSTMVDHAEATSADVVIAGCFVDVFDLAGNLVSSRAIVPESASIVGPACPPPELTDDLVNLLGYAWNKLYRGDLLRHGAYRFPAGISLVEDMLFNAEVLSSASRVAVLDRAFVHYAQRPADTLGTTFYPDFLDLRLRAIEALRPVFNRWSVEPAEAGSVVAHLQVDALRNLARRTSERPGVSLRQKSGDLRASRSRIDALVRTDHLHVGRRLERLALRRLPAVVVIAAFTARRRLRRNAP